MLKHSETYNYYVAMGSWSLWTAGCLCRSCCVGLVSTTRTRSSDHSNKMLSDHYRPVSPYMNVSQKPELATVHSGIGEGGGGAGGTAAPLLSGVFHTPVVPVIPFSCMSIACPPPPTF